MSDRCIGREMLWFDLLLTVHLPHTYTVTTGTNAELETRLSVDCFTAAVLLLYTDFVSAGLSGFLWKNNPPLFLIVLCAYDNTL